MLPFVNARSVLPAAPEVDDRAAIDHCTDRRAQLVLGAIVLDERVDNLLKARIVGTVERYGSVADIKGLVEFDHGCGIVAYDRCDCSETGGTRGRRLSGIRHSLS